MHWNAIRVVVVDVRGSLLFGIFLTVIAGFIGGSGVLLMRRAKLGLWGLYFLSAYFVFLFFSGLVHDIILRSDSGAPRGNRWDIALADLVFDRRIFFQAKAAVCQVVGRREHGSGPGVS